MPEWTIFIIDFMDMNIDTIHDIPQVCLLLIS